MFKKRNPGNCLVSNCGCTTSPPPPLACSPCAIPFVTLSVTGTVTCSNVATDFPFTLIWNGVSTASGARWSSGCVALPCAVTIVIGQAQATYASYVLSCTGASVSTRFVASFFDTAAHCASNTNIYGVNGTTGVPNNQFIYPDSSVGHSLASIGDCTFFDLQLKTGSITNYIISQ